MDPCSNERHEISSEKYWNCKEKFTSSMSSRLLVRFVVLSVEPMVTTTRVSAKKRSSAESRKPRMAECVVAREDDLGYG